MNGARGIGICPPGIMPGFPKGAPIWPLENELYGLEPNGSIPPSVWDWPVAPESAGVPEGAVFESPIVGTGAS